MLAVRGEALAARKLGLVEAWRHDAFFDYVDRWMTETDTPEIKAAFHENPIFKAWFTQTGKRATITSGTVWDTWVKELWTQNRGPIAPLHPSAEILKLIEDGKPLPK